MTSTGSEVTPGERRNGWTAETLRKYLDERDYAVNQVHRVGNHANDPEPLRVHGVKDMQDDW